MADMVSVEALKNALLAEGFNVDDERFVRALRFAENPSGCKFCGARTSMAVPVNPKKPDGPHKLACCGKKL